jgi:tRNA A-37 threonylcarbamoyl transferase component Bud32
MESFGNSAAQESESKEHELEVLFSKLPEELRARWKERTDELNVDAAIQFVREVIKNRNEAKEKIFTEVHDIENPELKEEVRSIISHIENTFGNHDHFLGSGTIARVYSMPYAPHVCVKYILEDMLAKHGNTMRQEVEYMTEMRNFLVAGIRIPKVYFKHTLDLSCFGMERIDGMSLDQIIANPHDCDFLEKIKEQDMTEVIGKMKKFIETMHKDMKLVHRDLLERNIMVDREGNWYVIDFGKAKRIEIGDTTTDLSEATDFPTAENAIRKLFRAIS